MFVIGGTYKSIVTGNIFRLLAETKYGYESIRMNRDGTEVPYSNGLLTFEVASERLVPYPFSGYRVNGSKVMPLADALKLAEELDGDIVITDTNGVKM